MDTLSASLEALHPVAALRAALDLPAPWGFDAPDESFAFYTVTRGVCWIEVRDADPLQLAPGDYALVAPAHPHLLRDSRSTRALPFDQFAESLGDARRAGAAGSITSLIAGSITLQHEASDPVVAAIPPLLHVAAGTTHEFSAALQLFTTAATSRSPGSDALTRRLGELLFVHAAIVAMNRATSGWLRAVADPQIGAAMSLMHERSGEAWTVESLADAVRMSRAAFAVRFHELAGEPPLTYLTRLRMRFAAETLTTTDAPLSTVAAAAGYESEAAFNKAFKRIMGVTPGKYRRGAPPNRRRVARRSADRSAGAKRPDWSFID